LQARRDEEEPPSEDAESFDLKAKKTLHGSFAVRDSLGGEKRPELAESLGALVAKSKPSLGVRMK
jgi:hypothetical protein